MMPGEQGSHGGLIAFRDPPQQVSILDTLIHDNQTPNCAFTG